MAFESILNRAPVPAVRLNPNVPPELERIIDKCREKARNFDTSMLQTFAPTCNV